MNKKKCSTRKMHIPAKNFTGGRGRIFEKISKIKALIWGWNPENPQNKVSIYRFLT